MKRKQPFTFSEFKDIYSKVPRLCVDIVIKTEKGTLLILRQNNGWENQWHLPGGTVFYHEPVKTALKRIALEEIGIEITVGKFLGYVEYPSEVKERGFGYSVSLTFECSPKNQFKILPQTKTIKFFNKLPTNTVYKQKIFLTKKSCLTKD